MRRHCQIKWNSEAWLISKVKQYPRKGRICHHVLVGRDQTGQYLITYGGVLIRASKLAQPTDFFLKGKKGREKEKTNFKAMF